MKLQASERTEFKSIVVTDIKKEIVAFANCDGGKIYIGIEDDGTVIGVEDSDSVASVSYTHLDVYKRQTLM